jgi:hypothetical protein
MVAHGTSPTSGLDDGDVRPYRESGLGESLVCSRGGVSAAGGGGVVDVDPTRSRRARPERRQEGTPLPDPARARSAQRNGAVPSLQPGSANRTLLLVAGGEEAGDEAMLEKARESMEAGATGLIFGTSGSASTTSRCASSRGCARSWRSTRARRRTTMTTATMATATMTKATMTKATITNARRRNWRDLDPARRRGSCCSAPSPGLVFAGIVLRLWGLPRCVRYTRMAVTLITLRIHIGSLCNAQRLDR